MREEMKFYSSIQIKPHRAQTKIEMWEREREEREPYFVTTKHMCRPRMLMGCWLSLRLWYI